MSKKKLMIIGIVALVLIATIAVAVPVFAASSNATPNPTQLTQKNKAGALLRLLLVQDQTKAFATLHRLRLRVKYRQIKLPQSIIFGPNIIHNSPRLSY